MGQIGNMDEVSLTFDVPSNKTVEAEGPETVTIKTSVQRENGCTVVLACTADGNKLPPLVIFKRKAFPKEKIPRGIKVHVHPKGWMDEEGMRVWIKKVWENRPGASLKKPSLLVLDFFRSHLTESTKREFQMCKTEMAVIPGGLTSQLQPLEVSINEPFKAFMREKWNKYNQHGRVKKPGLSKVCQWIKTSWDAVEEDIVIKSFQKCGISNALDGKEDKLIYEDCSSESSSVEFDVEDSSEDEEFPR